MKESASWYLDCYLGWQKSILRFSYISLSCNIVFCFVLLPSLLYYLWVARRCKKWHTGLSCSDASKWSDLAVQDTTPTGCKQPTFKPGALATDPVSPKFSPTHCCQDKARVASITSKDSVIFYSDVVANGTVNRSLFMSQARSESPSRPVSTSTPLPVARRLSECFWRGGVVNADYKPVELETLFADSSDSTIHSMSSNEFIGQLPSVTVLPMPSNVSPSIFFPNDNNFSD